MVRYRFGRLALVPVLLVSASLGALLPAVTAAETPQAAGSRPSPLAKQICEAKAQNLIRDVLGVGANVSTPTWRSHLYSCDYRYPTGTIVLSVKELSSWSQTYDYFDKLGTVLHRTIPLVGLGQGAFRVRNGSVVVRKDWKVLLVNVSGVPRQFGEPPIPPEGVSLSVAGVIMACWHGD